MSGGPRIVRMLRRAARRCRDERGQVLVMLAAAGIGLIAMVSFVVDYGRVQNAQKELQAAADASALAAAQDLPNGPAASTALAFSAGPGASKGNTRPDLPNVSTSYDLKCLTFLQSLGLTQCPNAIKVDQDADVPLLFLGNVGVPGIHVHATALAAMRGGSAFPLDVMIVLDRTGSMSQPASKIQQARAGVQAFLSAMRPSSDRIGLAIFPPTNHKNCDYGEPGHPYENARDEDNYVVVPLRTDFRTSDTGPLNSSSPLVQAVSGSCPTTGGITSYTTAIQYAENELVAHGRPDAQDVIIFFTDGEANYGPYYLGNNDPQRTTPCGSALDLATTLKAGAPPAGEPPKVVAGTWVYTILYTTPSAQRCKGWSSAHQGSTNCNVGQDTQFPCDEQPAPVTASETLRQMASVGSDGVSRFYTSQNDLTQIFRRVAIDLSGTRLLPDDTQ